MSDAALIAEIREGWKLTEAGGPALAFLEARLEWLRSCVGVANIRLDDGINTMKARQAEDRAEIARLKALLAGVDRVGDD
jgi:hypothetical protein